MEGARRWTWKRIAFPGVAPGNRVRQLGVYTRACSHYAQGFDDEREAQECQEDDIELFEA